MIQLLKSALALFALIYPLQQAVAVPLHSDYVAKLKIHWAALDPMPKGTPYYSSGRYEFSYHVFDDHHGELDQVFVMRSLYTRKSGHGKKNSIYEKKRKAALEEAFEDMDYWEEFLESDGNPKSSAGHHSRRGYKAHSSKKLTREQIRKFTDTIKKKYKKRRIPKKVRNDAVTQDTAARTANDLKALIRELLPENQENEEDSKSGKDILRVLSRLHEMRYLHIEHIESSSLQSGSPQSGSGNFDAPTRISLTPDLRALLTPQEVDFVEQTLYMLDILSNVVEATERYQEASEKGSTEAADAQLAELQHLGTLYSEELTVLNRLTANPQTNADRELIFASLVPSEIDSYFDLSSNQVAWVDDIVSQTISETNPKDITVVDYTTSFPSVPDGAITQPSTSNPDVQVATSQYPAQDVTSVPEPATLLLLFTGLLLLGPHLSRKSAFP